MNQGYIKLHRSLIDWEWYNDGNTFRLFIHCLLKANHAPKKWRGVAIESGQFLTSRDTLSQETGLTVQQVRTSLNKLKSTSEITIITTSRYTLISVCKWGTYQNGINESNQPNNQQDNKQVTINQPASNQQVTTNKNDKNDKNEEKEQSARPLGSASVDLPHDSIQDDSDLAHLVASVMECSDCHHFREQDVMNAIRIAQEGPARARAVQTFCADLANVTEQIPNAMGKLRGFMRNAEKYEADEKTLLDNEKLRNYEL